MHGLHILNMYVGSGKCTFTILWRRAARVYVRAIQLDKLPLTISPLPQLTFDVQILHIFISFGKHLMRLETQ